MPLSQYDWSLQLASQTLYSGTHVHSLAFKSAEHSAALRDMSRASWVLSSSEKSSLNMDPDPWHVSGPGNKNLSFPSCPMCHTLIPLLLPSAMFAAAHSVFHSSISFVIQTQGAPKTML